MAEQKGVFLAGYTDRLSARPGETIGFHISSLSRADLSCHLVRSIGADPNPQANCFLEEDASQWWSPSSRTIPSRQQPIPSNGSYATSRTPVPLPPLATTTQSITVEIWVYPTLHTKQANSALQIVWSWGGLCLQLDTELRVVVALGGAEHVGEMKPSSQSSLLQSSSILRLQRWYRMALTVEFSTRTLRLDVARGQQTTSDQSATIPDETWRQVIGGGYFQLATEGTFTGKLEAPRIFHDDRQLWAGWDTSSHQSGWTVPAMAENSTTSIPQLVLHDHPMRAVKGHLWDGTEMCWKHCPEQYGAIYFHSGDVYDFGWDCDVKWTIPADTPSGIYVLRLRAEEGYEEALPVFVAAPRLSSNVRKNKLCLLVSTFTYVMYGNHARDDFSEAVLQRIQEWNKAYPNTPSQHKEYGWSTYNLHDDGTGICFASHRRPLFNLRPGYVTFGTTESGSGLRHFPADSHVTAWLHRHHYEFDIVTDHDLHRDGVAALEGYSTLLTGSHPEYHSLSSLTALQDFRDRLGGNLLYLGGNGFYWRIAVSPDDADASLLEIRRTEDGIRTWASEPGEYYHALDGTYGGLWRRKGRAPQALVGIGFKAQGNFASGIPYERVCYDRKFDWIFAGLNLIDGKLGDFGFSGNGAAGFELDGVDRSLDTDDHDVHILASANPRLDDDRYMLVPEEVLTTYSTTSGLSTFESRRADMVYFQTSSGAHVFSVGSITFCGSLPWNNYENDISTLLQNVLRRFTAEQDAST